jgi:hypothetical protein
MNPVVIRGEYIEYRGSRPFKVSMSDHHSEKLYCRDLEKGREVANEKLITCMRYESIQKMIMTMT